MKKLIISLLIFLFIMIIGIIIIGCSSDDNGNGEPTLESTPKPDIEGTWVGTFTESYEDMGDIAGTINFTQDWNTLGGTATFTELGPWTLTGTISGYDINITLDSTIFSGWIITATGTLSGDTITGTWSDNIEPQWGGTYTINRQ